MGWHIFFAFRRPINLKMKKLIIGVVAVFIYSCETTSTVITGSWKSPKQNKNYHTILVAALTNHAVVKSTIENELAGAFNSNGIKTLKSIDEFPPNMSTSDSDRQALMDKMKTIGTDAILTVSLLKKETESRYVPGNIAYDPYTGYGYNRRFWGYYSYWYPNLYEQGYYSNDHTYYMETNLYDASTEELIWSGQSETYNPIDMPTFAKEFADLIVDKMKKDGVLSTGLSSR
jgi:hypothetical protein